MSEYRDMKNGYLCNATPEDWLEMIACMADCDMCGYGKKKDDDIEPPKDNQ
ncbi:MAG: hypothetical protein GY861_14590 [bacterium]|nr:hypothetical protein [bacterium]